MLFSFDSGQEIKKIPHQEVWKVINKRLSKIEIQKIKDEINKIFDSHDFKCSSKMVPPDWTNTAFQVIYDKASRENYELSAKMFGLIVWVTLMERPEMFGFDRYNLIPNREFEGMTYFKIPAKA